MTAPLPACPPASSRQRMDLVQTGVEGRDGVWDCRGGAQGCDVMR